MRAKFIQNKIIEYQYHSLSSFLYSLTFHVQSTELFHFTLLIVLQDEGRRELWEGGVFAQTKESLLKPLTPQGGSK